MWPKPSEGFTGYQIRYNIPPDDDPADLHVVYVESQAAALEMYAGLVGARYRSIWVYTDGIQGERLYQEGALGNPAPDLEDWEL